MSENAARILPSTNGAPRAQGAHDTRSVVGTARRKVDAAAKVTGELRFADDLSLPRMLHCKLLRSRYPHARVIRIDTSRAEALQGVIAVMTGRELPIPLGILPI